MAKTKQKKGGDRRQNAQQPTPPMHDHASDDSDVEIVMDEVPERDETEEELERLVFGDHAGFKEGLRDFALDDASQEEDQEDGDLGDTGLEGLDDAALFFTDIGPDNDAIETPAISADLDESLETWSRQPPAWEDSDDERMTVSLASVPRLRKLRRTEAEDLVNGKEYGRRLRQQFELLSPRPEWAQYAADKHTKKKRRLTRDGNSSAEEVDTDEDMDADMNDDEDMPSVAPISRLLQSAEGLVRRSGTGVGKKRKIRPEVLDIQRTKDIPGIQPSAITSLSFHPQYPLLLTSGPSSTLYLHHIVSSPPAPMANPLLTSLHIRGAPLATTEFHPTDSRIFLSARRKYFHIWNLETGQVEKVTRVYGQQHEQKSMERFKLSPDGKHMALLGSARKGGGIINIISTSTLQWVTQIRIESRGGIADFAWWREGNGLCIAGKNGEVTEWSLQDQQIIARWQDEGAVGTTVLSLGGQHEFGKSPIGTDRWVSIGSSSGIVNIYDRRVWLANAAAAAQQGAIVPAQPKPTKALDRLTTPISNLAFSPDGQLMAMASKWKRDALRIVHLPSCTVYKNWPTNATPLGRITGVAFTSGDIIGNDVAAALAVANEQGKVRIWEIR